ncbi:MAG: aconitase X swivel domain-containing protein [Candidatus Nitrosocaldus sp.]
MSVYSVQCKSIVKGYGEGYALATGEPINLLSIDTNGVVNDSAHILNGKSVAGKVLVFPNAIGSSVGAYRLYAAKVNGNAPTAVICSKADIITASACAISNIPLVECAEYDRLMGLCSNSSYLIVRADAINASIKIMIRDEVESKGREGE